MWEEEEEEKEARRGVVTSAITLSSKRRRSSLAFLTDRGAFMVRQLCLKLPHMHLEGEEEGHLFLPVVPGELAGKVRLPRSLHRLLPRKQPIRLVREGGEEVSR